MTDDQKQEITQYYIIINNGHVAVHTLKCFK